MLGVSLRRYAMTEIENQRTIAELLQNIVDAVFQRPAA